MPASKKKNHKTKGQKPDRTSRFFGKIKAFFVDTWPIFFLTLIIAALCFLNYDQGTFLTGWDNLHPEFNPQIYLKRTIFAVWQEYQSTGLLGGMAHSADLPRVIFIYLLSLFHYPTNLIRYTTTFLPLIFGPVFVYLLLHKIFSYTKHSHKTIKISSFLGALFYLFNLSTMQTFFIPFETFTWFYGFIPALIYYLIIYLEKPKLTNFLRLFFISFISSPAFYVETMFVVLFLCLIPFLIESIFKNKKAFANTVTTTLSLITIILPHLYWLLPVIFFVVTNGHITTQNHINSVSSVETYYRNLEFANLQSLFSFKSYLFKYLDLGPNQKYQLLLTPWLNHLNSPIIKTIGVFFVVTTIIGIYYSLKTKIKHTYSFLVILIICAFFLLGGGQITSKSIPLLSELFRSPFTKFSLPLAFSFSFFFSVGVIFILDIFAFLDTHLTYNFTLFTFSFLLFTYISPAFSGNFIDQNMRVNIPNQYFELFSYLNNQPVDDRIANFPQHTFWGWNYYSWGQRGSGFTWYGIKQPILDRAFDVWEKTSEDYYQDVITALYSQNQEAFNQTIDQYNVGYILVDKSIVAPDTKASLGLNYLQEIINNSDQYQLEKTFGDNLYLYKNLNHKTKDFLSTTSATNQTTPLLNINQRPNQSWYEKAGFINTNINLNSEETNKTINIPSITESEDQLPYQIEYKRNLNSINLKITPITPYIFINNTQVDLDTQSQLLTVPLSQNTSKLIISLQNQYLSFDLPQETLTTSNYAYLNQIYLPTRQNIELEIYQGIPTEQYPIINSFINNEPKQCYTNKENRHIEKIVAPRMVTLLGTDVVACLSAPLPPVNPDQLLALSFTYYSPTLTTANANITNENYNANNANQIFESSKTPKRGQVFIKPTSDNKQANLILEAEETKNIQEITYKDIYLSSHDLLYKTSFKPQFIKSKKFELSSTQSAKIQFSLPITNTNLDIIQTPQSNSLFPESRNCDQFNNGQTVKITKDNNILYQSKNAIECDYLNLRHLPHNLNYIVGLDVTNQVGLPLVTCLENHQTRRCDVYERLKTQEGLQYLTSFIKSPKEQNGYTLHLFNQSFGNNLTQNSLNSITIHPFPLNFLKSISVQKSQNTFSHATITSSDHPFEFLYKLQVGATGSSVINLFQTKSPFWKAIQISPEDYNKPPLLLATKYLFLYQQSFKFAQTNTSNWYNSWDIPSGGNTILIIYIPQYLEFFGLIILIIIPLTLLPITLYQKTKK